MVSLLRVIDWMASVLFVRTCPLCHANLEDEMMGDQPRCICLDCLQRLERTKQAFQRGNSTEDLFYRESQFSRAASFYFYREDSPLRTLSHLFKYKNHPEMAYALAHEAAVDFMQSDFFEGIEVIVPVPLHPRRYRERGYNQSEYIAQAISDVTRIPIDTTHLLRVRNNPKQALRSGEERATNVQGVFAVDHPEEMYRKKILLVDDIITTGSTIRSCMETMTAFRGCEISVFALARTKYRTIQ